MKSLSEELKEIHNSLVGGVVYRFNADRVDIVSPVTKETKVLDSWLRSKDLPIDSCAQQCVVAKNRLYMIGGYTSGSGSLNTVYYAPILEDGGLGTWVQDTSLPMPIHAHQCVVTKNRLYMIDGHDGSVTLSTVYHKTLTTTQDRGASNKNHSGVFSKEQTPLTKQEIHDVLQDFKNSYITISRSINVELSKEKDELVYPIVLKDIDGNYVVGLDSIKGLNKSTAFRRAIDPRSYLWDLAKDTSEVSDDYIIVDYVTVLNSKEKLLLQTINPISSMFNIKKELREIYVDNTTEDFTNEVLSYARELIVSGFSTFRNGNFESTYIPAIQKLLQLYAEKKHLPSIKVCVGWIIEHGGEPTLGFYGNYS